MVKNFNPVKAGSLVYSQPFSENVQEWRSTLLGQPIGGVEEIHVRKPVEGYVIPENDLYNSETKTDVH